jgi:ABC-type transport system substrate-binding protein
VIRWNRTYTDASHLSTHNSEFAALPRHLLEEPLRAGSAEAFLSHPYWTRDYVGLGPFRIERWEAGAFIEAAAFEGEVLGPPKIDRVRLVFIGDGNTVLSNILAGEVQMSGDGALRVEQAITLRQEWAPRNGGDIVMQPNQWRAVNFQMRDDLATPRALLDPRTRRAFAHATDKQSINEALYGGLERVADFILPPLSELGLTAERAATKYPYDLRRVDQLMAELGFVKDPDGFYASPSEGRLAAELKTNAAPDNEKELAVVAAGYRSAGFEAQQSVLPVAQAQDPQVRATFPGMYVNSTPALESTLLFLNEANIPRAENRWRGNNRGGWANREYTRLAESFGATLDPQTRAEQIAEMARVFSTDLPAVSIVFRSHPWAHVADLQGPTDVPPETNIGWNLHEWQWRQGP